MSVFALRAQDRGVLRAWGAALVVASVVLPALPLGPVFAQPPLPLAALWAAYGWAAEDESGVRAPLTLAGIGLLHDQLAGGPYGLFVAIYLFAYIVGRGAAVVMSAPNMLSLWGGFVVTAAASVAIAHVLARWALGPNINVWPYAQAAVITALLFPIVRPLYMSAGPALQQARQRR